MHGRPLSVAAAPATATAASNAVANANAARHAASAVQAQACAEGGDSGGGGGRGAAGADGALVEDGDGSDDSDSGGEGGIGLAPPNMAFPQLRKPEAGAPARWKRLLGGATARHSPARSGLLGPTRLVLGCSTHSYSTRARAVQVASRGGVLA